MNDDNVNQRRSGHGFAAETHPVGETSDKKVKVKEGFSGYWCSFNRYATANFESYDCLFPEISRPSDFCKNINFWWKAPTTVLGEMTNDEDEDDEYGGDDDDDDADDDTVNGSVEKKPHPAVETTAKPSSRKLVDALCLGFSFVSFPRLSSSFIVLVMVMTTVTLTIVQLSEYLKVCLHNTLLLQWGKRPCWGPTCTRTRS